MEKKGEKEGKMVMILVRNNKKRGGKEKDKNKGKM